MHHRRTLSALLAAIAPDLPALTCRDLTADQVSLPLLPTRRPAPGAGADLVIVDEDELDRALAAVAADGMILARSRGALRRSPIPGVELRGTVRVGSEGWRLYVPRRDTAGDTRISVVVPVHNQLAALTRLVSVLAAETVHPPWELVVVDRGSEDGTASFLRGIRGSFRAIETDPGADLAAAVTAGFSVARGRLAFVLSPRWIPAAGWRESILAAADRHPEARAILGTVVEGRTGRVLPARSGPLGTPTVYRLPLESTGTIVRDVRIRTYLGRAALGHRRRSRSTSAAASEDRCANALTFEVLRRLSGRGTPA